VDELGRDAQSHAAAPLVAPGGSEAVLVVEDEEMARRMACLMLERRGYRVMVADGLERALRLADDRDQEVDLLLTDVIMPTMNGRELFELLHAKRPGLRVLYMSGYDANVVARHGVLEPGVHFLQKPFTAEALAAKVREALGG
jgi:two-component system cell cycle sensor histidine kinase/response regulator CckA